MISEMAPFSDFFSHGSLSDVFTFHEHVTGPLSSGTSRTSRFCVDPYSVLITSDPVLVFLRPVTDHIAWNRLPALTDRH